MLRQCFCKHTSTFFSHCLFKLFFCVPPQTDFRLITEPSSFFKSEEWTTTDTNPLRHRAHWDSLVVLPRQTPPDRVLFASKGNNLQRENCYQRRGANRWKGPLQKRMINNTKGKTTCLLAPQLRRQSGVVHSVKLEIDGRFYGFVVTAIIGLYCSNS